MIRRGNRQDVRFLKDMLRHAFYWRSGGTVEDSSLWRYDELQGLFQELVPDIENMQVLYGVAPTTPNQVTQYLTANNVVDFNQVVSVKVALLVAGPPAAARWRRPRPPAPGTEPAGQGRDDPGRSARRIRVPRHGGRW